MGAGTRQRRIEQGRRRARWTGAAGFAAAMATPYWLFHDVVEVLAAAQPTMELQYLSGWLPWGLLVAGLVFLLPVAWSAGMDPASRWFPRARAAYAGWGITLYLLGFLLAWQVMRIQSVGLS
jgi:hypothetical protein